MRDELARDEVDLVRQIAHGDLGAPLEELCRRYKGVLFGFGLKLLGDSWLAEELVQECLVRLWRTAARYDPDRGSVRTYVFTIARSIAIDLHRRPSSRPLGSLPDRDLPIHHDDIQRLVDSLTVRDALDALDALSPAHRQVLVLIHDHALTQAEIAARLEIPLGTVKTRVHHGMRALRDALRGRGFDV